LISLLLKMPNKPANLKDTQPASNHHLTHNLDIVIKERSLQMEENQP
jgi:hypothetical protein